MLLRLIIVTAFVALSAGCGTELPPVADSSLCDNADAGADVAALFPDTGPPSENVEGKWAALQILTASVTIAGAQASENRVTTLLIMDAVPDGDSYTFTEQICDISVDNIAGICGEGSLVTTVVPQAYIDALDYGPRPGTVTQAGGVLSLQLPKNYQLKGVKLDDPASDPLPTDPEDPAFWDQDGDGKPGMSLRFVQPGMFTGELYIGQRDWTELNGTIVAGGRIEGLMKWDKDEVILGSNPADLFDSSPQSGPSTDETKSRFIMVRIDADKDCAGIIADRTALFPGL